MEKAWTEGTKIREGYLTAHYFELRVDTPVRLGLHLDYTPQSFHDSIYMLVQSTNY